MFGYKLVKEYDYKWVIEDLDYCVSTIQNSYKIINDLDIPEEVKAKLWANSVTSVAYILNSEMRLSGRGGFDFETFFKEYCKKKDEA